MAKESNLNEPIENDSVPLVSHEEPPKEEAPAPATSKPENQGVKFSHRIIQYPNDELKIFETNSVIGSGSFGRVRKYYHKDKVVAVKEFSITGDDETISNIWNMVQREANILCRFQHENIVEIQGITQWPKVIGIIMEYVDGGNLKTLLSNDNKSDLSWKSRMDIANGITSGLDYIHNYDETKTFCHGDIKPANVLLTQSLQAKLADFGSAAFHRATAASTTTIKQVSSTQFTLIYVAPEFLEDNTRKRKPAMDMYSFAMVLYELISRKAPYSDSTTPMHVPALIMAKVKPSMKLIDKAMSQLETDDDRAAFSFLKELMQSCWNNNPNSRPSSKTVKMELSSFLLNLSQGFSLRIDEVQNTGAEAATTEGENPSARKTTKQNFQSSTSSASGRPSWSRGGTDSAKQTSGGKPSMEELFRTLSGGFPRDASQLEDTLESFLHATGASLLIGDQELVEDLLAKYTDSLLNSNFEEADRIREALRSLIVDDVDAEADKVFFFARRLKSEKHYLQSIAISDTAAALYARMKDPANDLERIQFCIQGMTIASEEMVKAKSNMKIIVGEHVIPLMHNWLQVMKGTSQVSEKWRCHTVSWALSNIERCELLAEQYEERKETLEEAVRGMREVFGSDVHRLHGRLFGTLLNNLAVAYKRQSRHEEASDLFKESIEAHCQAEDYFGNEENRNRDISISESNFKSSLRQVWEQQLQRD